MARTLLKRRKVAADAAGSTASLSLPEDRVVDDLVTPLCSHASHASHAALAAVLVGSVLATVCGPGAAALALTPNAGHDTAPLAC